MTDNDIDKVTMSSLQQMQDEVHKCNVQHGWFDHQRTFGDEVALLHSELSEMLECFREIGTEPRTQPLKEGEAIGKPDDVGSEVADVLIRLLDFSWRYGIDLEKEFDRKMKYNWTRPFMHGGKKI